MVEENVNPEEKIETSKETIEKNEIRFQGYDVLK